MSEFTLCDRIIPADMESSSNTFEIVDIGANLTSNKFSDIPKIISRALNQNVSTIIVTGKKLRHNHIPNLIGTNEKHSKDARLLASKYKNVLYSTAGVHPHDAKNFTDDTIQVLRDLAQFSEVVSIGECGLDYDRMFSPAEVQQQV